MQAVVKVVNRTAEPFEFQHDGIVYIVPAGVGGELLCTTDVAMHGYKRSIRSLDPIANVAEFRVGVKGQDGKEITDCSPLGKAPAGPELITRGSGLPKVVEKTLVNPIGQERASGNPGSISVGEAPNKGG